MHIFLLWYFAILVCYEGNTPSSLAIFALFANIWNADDLGSDEEANVSSYLLSSSQVSVAIRISIFLFVSSLLMSFSLFFIDLALTVDILMFLLFLHISHLLLLFAWDLVCLFHFVLFFFLFSFFCSLFSCVILAHKLL